MEYVYSDIYVAQSMKNSGIIRCHQDQQAYYARFKYVSRWHLMITVTALGQKSIFKYNIAHAAILGLHKSLQNTVACGASLHPANW